MPPILQALQTRDSDILLQMWGADMKYTMKHYWDFVFLWHLQNGVPQKTIDEMKELIRNEP